MVGSLRRDCEGDLTIGRQQINDLGMRPNDIMLNPTDASLSRSHSRIIYNQGLLKKINLTDDYLAFFMGYHPRLGAFSPLRKVSRDILTYIWEFMKPRRQFFATDNGTIYGTYVKY